MSNNEEKEWLGHGGSCVENKDEILGEVDRLLGVSKPPDLEILFGNPHSFAILSFFLSRCSGTHIAY
jgi:hypothetical protein